MMMHGLENVRFFAGVQDFRFSQKTVKYPDG
jgi:hypothetical protein